MGNQTLLIKVHRHLFYTLKPYSTYLLLSLPNVNELYMLCDSGAWCGAKQQRRHRSPRRGSPPLPLPPLLSARTALSVNLGTDFGVRPPLAVRGPPPPAPAPAPARALAPAPVLSAPPRRVPVAALRGALAGPKLPLLLPRGGRSSTLRGGEGESGSERNGEVGTKLGGG